VKEGGSKLLELQFDFKTTRDEFRRSMPYNVGGVYFLFDKDWRLLYIGQTVNFRDRFESHLYGSPLSNEETRKLFNLFYHVGCIVVNDPEEAMQLEAEYIREYGPLCNVRGNIASRVLSGSRNKSRRNATRGGNKVAKHIRIPVKMHDRITELVELCHKKDSYSKVSFNTIIEDALDLYMPKLEDRFKIYSRF
jgi:predicted GIY-YIG superfamily endonuclease